MLVILATDTVGGAETQTQVLLQGLSTRFEIVLLTHRAVQPLFCDRDLGVVCFEERGLHNPFDYRWRNLLRYAQAIAEVAHRVKADLIYAVMHNASLFLAIARWRHAYRLGSRRLIGSLHGSLSSYFAQQERQPNWIERLLIQVVLKTLPVIVIPSQRLAKELVQDFGARVGQVYPIYNGVDLEQICQRSLEILPTLKQEPWIATCCRLSKEKDFLTLLRAFAGLVDYPTARLIIVGEGSLRDQIGVWASELGISGRVHLTGFESNPFRWMRQADIFVLSSFSEGFGNVIIEAMALGIPVVASDCPWGPAEIIEPGTSGELFPVADAEALVRTLRRLLAHPDERERLAHGARERAPTFSARNMVENYRALFQQVLRG